MIVIQGHDRPTPHRTDELLRGRSVREMEARRSGVCSVCETAGPPAEIDASGRCRECQP